MTDIKVGDLVRSYDFEVREVEGPNACYVEGIVEGFVTDGCRRYEIRVTRTVWCGAEVDFGRDRFYPPVNGTPTSLGRVTDGVVLVDITTSYELVATGGNS